jgi:hypothetical protein
MKITLLAATKVSRSTNPIPSTTTPEVVTTPPSVEP